MPPIEKQKMTITVDSNYLKAPVGALIITVKLGAYAAEAAAKAK